MSLYTLEDSTTLDLDQINLITAFNHNGTFDVFFHNDPMPLTVTESKTLIDTNAWGTKARLLAAWHIHRGVIGAGVQLGLVQVLRADIINDMLCISFWAPVQGTNCRFNRPVGELIAPEKAFQLIESIRRIQDSPDVREDARHLNIPALWSYAEDEPFAIKFRLYF